LATLPLSLTRRSFISKTLTGLALSCAPFASQNLAAQAQTRKPNIIFIYTDDQAAWGTGVSGYPYAETPNMDNLARQGAYLKNSFVTTPVCSPARASLMASRYSTELGIYDFIPHPKHKLFSKEWVDSGLNPALVTFPELLQQEGYSTGLVGKWHLGDWTEGDTNKFHPQNHGFDYFMGLTGGGISPNDPLLEEDGKVKTFKGLTSDILADDALTFIEKNKNHPFLLCLHHRAPHTKWLPVANEDWAPFENLDPIPPEPDYPDLDVERVKKMTREYLASIRGVDRNLGKILSLLDELHLAENTVVIFTSDHGYNMGHNGIWHKGNGKWATLHEPPATDTIAQGYRPNLYDNSIRVPAMVRWPGIIKAGTVVQETTSSLDWYPTICAMAGIEVPKDVIVRGKDIMTLLKGEQINNWDNDFYGEYQMINYCQSYMRMYRTPKWKLIRDFINPERDELYNLKKDPEENFNLIHTNSPVVQNVIKELNKKIVAKMTELDDPILNLAK
jgi:arylsulfatase A-like enzyme